MHKRAAFGASVALSASDQPQKCQQNQQGSGEPVNRKMSFLCKAVSKQEAALYCCKSE